MAVPKKKSSRSRRNMRRFSVVYKLDGPTLTICPECNELVRTHRVCGKCLKYTPAAQKKTASKSLAKNA